MAKKKNPPVAVLMGSQSDLSTMREAVSALKEFGIPAHVEILSAHRTPDETAEFARGASKKGFKVLIAGAGGAAHLPGMIAAVTELPVIGVPVSIGALQGQDALLSIVQMPRGIPVATVAIGNAWNAGLLAVQILSVADPKLGAALRKYKEGLRRKVLASSRPKV